jgi:hypothetical protein
MDVDLVINVDIAKDIIKASVGIGLPLALQQIDKDKMQTHASEVCIATSSALNFLDDETKPVNPKDVDKVLSIIDKEISAPERYAIQSSIDLILSLAKKEIQPEQSLNPDMREILIFFLREVNNVYSTALQTKSIGNTKLTYTRKSQ